MFVVSSRVRHTRCSLLTGVQTCALPIYSAIGRTSFGLGEFAEARRHLEQALALNEGERAAGSSETDRPESPVIDLCCLSWTSFALGEPAQALAQCRRSPHVAAARGASYDPPGPHGTACYLHQCTDTPHPLALRATDAHPHPPATT